MTRSQILLKFVDTFQFWLGSVSSCDTLRDDLRASAGGLDVECKPVEFPGHSLRSKDKS